MAAANVSDPFKIDYRYFCIVVYRDGYMDI